MRTENYDRDLLDEYLNEKDCGASAQEYLKSYFFKVDSPVCVFYWVPEENKFDVFTDQEIKSRFIPGSKTYFKSKEAGVKKIQNWFFNELNDSYRTGIRLNDEKIYTIGNQKYVNLFEGFGFNMQVTKYDDKVMESLVIILKHIKEVICNNNKDLYSYILKWIGTICNGKKNESALYLKSGQGTGKSMFTTFLCQKVFQSCSHITSDVSLLDANAFNWIFKGKVVISFEELPTTGKHEWEKMNGILKSYITGKTIELQEKHKPRINTPNILNFIINSNVNCIKLEADDRRYLLPDISDKYVANRTYFNRLQKHLDTEDVGKAFFMYVYNYANNSDFNAAIIPITDNKTDNIVDNLSNVYQFIKKDYLATKTNINTTFGKFYEEYKEFCDTKKVMSTIDFSRKLQSINIYSVKTKNVNYVKASFIDLVKIFHKKNWIHELDEIDIDGIDLTDSTKENTDYVDVSDIYDNLLNDMKSSKVPIDIKKEVVKKETILNKKMSVTAVPKHVIVDDLEAELEAELNAKLKKEEEDKKTKKIVTKEDHSKLLKKTKFISNKETNPLDFGVKKTKKSIHTDDMDLILNLTD